MSLVKALTGKRRYSASARDWVGGFDRKQAYRLLRCVDKGGDRRAALRDLVVFVFATWTEELNRLTAAADGDEEVHQRRRQLQKVLHWRLHNRRFQKKQLAESLQPVSNAAKRGAGGSRPSL